MALSTDSVTVHREPKLKLAPESIRRLKRKLRRILRRGRGRNLVSVIAKENLVSIRPQRFGLLVLALLLAACASQRFSEEQTGGFEGGVEIQGGATVISGVTLEDETGSVLDALVGRVPNFRIRRISGDCPQISLRTSVSFESVTNPQVYVDGTQIADTCILESLLAQNVELVEIYPMGVTSRPGYATHSHGLILVFLRSG
jgi:hypothetical protein